MKVKAVLYSWYVLFDFFFFPIFVLFFLTVETVTNSMSKEMELETECETKPRYIHKIL